MTKEIYRGFRHTTNNRMELMGVIAGLEAVKEGWKIEVYTDSKYVVDAINKGWVVKWRSNGWKRNKREYALNTDLWEKLLSLLEKRTVVFYWIKGHSGHPENERCDRLAMRAIKESQYWQEDIREEYIMKETPQEQQCVVATKTFDNPMNRFDPDRHIAILWSVDDVLGLRKDLSDEQAMTVLREAERKHDPSAGINWTVLECHADNLFPLKS